MLSFSGLQKVIGSRTLFADFTCQFNAGSCYGVVGANGSGKSTLLRMIAGDEEISGGTIGLVKGAKIGRLLQDQFTFDAEPIIDVAMGGDTVVFNALVGKQALLSEDRFDVERLAELETLIAAHQGYSLKSRAGQILEGLGIKSAVHEQALKTLSGGMKLRVLLARLLVSAPDVLLLDEPTNHLDIVSIQWLERFLRNFSGCTLVVSHDRFFLDRICTQIADIDFGTLTLYHGNYTKFVEMKELKKAQRESERAGIEAEIAHKQAYVNRFRAQATKARQAQSRLKQIEKIEIPDALLSSRKSPQLKFDIARPSGREVLEMEGVSHAFGEKKVLHDLKWTIRRGEKIAVVGPNGIGKSTLMRLIIGDLQKQEGRIKLGYEVHPGYFAQEKEKMVQNPDQSAESWLWQWCPQEPLEFVKKFLGRVLISGQEAKKEVSCFSGGELARIDLARLMIQKPNLLILDEPTNHLDTESIDELVAALKLYEGTLIFVSHDRYFVSQVASKVLELTIEGATEYVGGFDDYLRAHGEDYLDAALQSKKSKEKAEPTNKQQRLEAYEQSKTDKALVRKRDNDLKQLMAQIEKLEEQKKLIEERFSDSQFYMTTSSIQQNELKRDLEQIGASLDALYIQWENAEPIR